MKLTFLCGSLEPGRDGVGDYTRRLAGELIRQGVSCQAVALNERAISNIIENIQVSEGTEIPVLRLPTKLTWRERAKLAKKWVSEFQPDWVSLQFVPFAFQKKGLPFGFGRVVDEIAGPAKRHIMFHELWVGCCDSHSIKYRLWGALQKGIIKKIARHANILNTSNSFYQAMLRHVNLDADVFTLFGNFPITAKEHRWIWAELAQLGVSPISIGDYFVVGMAGSYYTGFPLEGVIELLTEKAAQQAKKLVVLGIGRSHTLPAQEWMSRVRIAATDVIVTHFGEQSPERISAFFSVLDLGVPTTQRQRMGKSGIAAAMYEHGVPIEVYWDQPIIGYSGPWDSDSAITEIFQTVSMAAIRLRTILAGGLLMG